jgi:hypothetical protein
MATTSISWPESEHTAHKCHPTESHLAPLVVTSVPTPPQGFHAQAKTVSRNVYIDVEMSHLSCSVLLSSDSGREEIGRKRKEQRKRGEGEKKIRRKRRGKLMGENEGREERKGKKRTLWCILAPAIIFLPQFYPQHFLLVRLTWTVTWFQSRD